MEFKELIQARRSVRNFKEGANISSEDIKEIIDASMQAPSWKNTETARCYVANTPESIEKAREALPAFNQSSSKNAALIITTFVKDSSGFTAGTPDNELSNKWGAYDLGLNNAYMILAAKEKGYDTLIMGIRDAGVLRKTFDIPKTEQIVSVIALGVAEGSVATPPRKAADEVCRFL